MFARILLPIVMLPLFFSPGMTWAQAKVDPLTIKFAHAGSPTHPYSVGANILNPILEKSSGGAIKLQVFCCAQLGSERELAEGTRLGTINMTSVAGEGALPAWVPELQVFGLPFIIRNRTASGYASRRLAEHQRVQSAGDGKQVPSSGPAFQHVAVREHGLGRKPMERAQPLFERGRQIGGRVGGIYLAAVAGVEDYDFLAHLAQCGERFRARIVAVRHVFADGERRAGYSLFLAGVAARGELAVDLRQSAVFQPGRFLQQRRSALPA